MRYLLQRMSDVKDTKRLTQEEKMGHRILKIIKDHSPKKHHLATGAINNNLYLSVS